MGLVGCIYVPASHHYQSDGLPRPESLVGADRPIQVGKTSVVDALIAIQSQEVRPSPVNVVINPYNFHPRRPIELQLSNDGDTVAAGYELTTGKTFWLLCGTIDSVEPRWLLLDIDDGNVVSATRTVSRLPEAQFSATSHVSIARRFSEEELRRLSAAGITLRTRHGSGPALLTTIPTTQPLSDAASVPAAPSR